MLSVFFRVFPWRDNEPFADKRRLRNGTFCPISASGSNFNPRNTPCIPVVEIFAFLELEQISADFENYHFSKVSEQKP